ncbi:MAG: hypothetical protein N5P05_001956 [Chroococcopsis gigantea SAG 12.99]|nr:PEP-CTERM sorting domain-containing protein [Chlorogloea purpurea SAG 13.99]MDV3000350.1 hypothetical protein [Chroococcopsis gigantea SAG 12.99]
MVTRYRATPDSHPRVSLVDKYTRLFEFYSFSAFRSDMGAMTAFGFGATFKRKLKK